MTSQSSNGFIIKEFDTSKISADFVRKESKILKLSGPLFRSAHLPDQDALSS